MSENATVRPKVNTSPLTEKERRIIERVRNEIWDRELRDQVALIARNRGFTTGPYDSPGDLAEALKRVCRES
jgi:hypothetical protein